MISTINGLPVSIVRKAISIWASLAVTDEAVRLAVVSKLGWIKRQRAKFKGQPRQSAREMVRGESHYYLGTRYRLRVTEQDGSPRVVLRNKSTMDLHVRPGTSAEQRERALHRWYRQQLKELIPPLVEKWQSALGVQVADWGIRKMKTKWGTCRNGVCIGRN
jgi:predicted metal-dependent hydrolase